LVVAINIAVTLKADEWSDEEPDKSRRGAFENPAAKWSPVAAIAGPGVRKPLRHE
jgi:hypothetical protein